MNGNVFLDTNIIIQLFNGDEYLAQILNSKRIIISFITQLELLSFSNITKNEYELIENLLDDVVIIDINSEIKSNCINIRKKYNIKLPDSIIVATSMFVKIPLLTSDKKLSNITSADIVLYA